MDNIKLYEIDAKYIVTVKPVAGFKPATSHEKM